MTNWYYHDPSQGRVGPINEDAVREHFRAGRIQRDTLVWREGLREWQPLQRLENELGLGATPPPLPLDIAAAPAATPATAATPAPAAAPSSQGRADFTAALDAAEAPRPQPSASDATGSSAAQPNATPASAAPSNASPSAAGSAPAASGPSQPQRSVSPADYAPAHVARRQSAPPPKRGMSGCAIALIVLAVLAVPVIGILAAIAIPAYQDYTHRAKLTGALSASNDYKLQVAQYYAAHQKCPTNASDGFRPAADYASAQIASVQFGRLKDGGECAIQLELRGFNRPQLDGRKIWLSFEPASAQWTCSSDVERASLLPQACRN